MDWLALANARGLRFRKELGQHLLFDQAILAQIARLAVPAPGTPVLEIGAGAGALTLALQNAGGAGIAVEVDPAMGKAASEVVKSGSPEVAEPENRVSGKPPPFSDSPFPRLPVSPDCPERASASRRVPRFGRVEVRIQDFFDSSGADLPRIDPGLEEELVRLADRAGAPLTAVGNLPYRLYRDMILALLRSRVPLDRMVWVVQAEAADRMRAEPGDRLYDPFPILLRSAGEVRKVREIPASAFHPRPRVRSSLVVWTARGLEAWRAAGTGELEPVLERLFRQRRKTVGAVLKSMEVGKSGSPEVRKSEGREVGESGSRGAAVARICGAGVLGMRMEGLTPEEAVRVARAAFERM